jgi:hypothetical protein
MTSLSAPDVSDTICWQQLANLDCMTTVLSKVSAPKQHSVISLEMTSEEEAHTTSTPIFMMSHWMITASQMENHMYQRTRKIVINYNKLF